MLFSIAGLVYILIITSYYDLGVSPDSTVYMEVAENFIRNGRFTDFNGKFVTHFPPMYPMALATISDLFGVKVLVAANYFSAAALFLSILLANLLFIKWQFSTRSIILSNIFLLISPAFGVFLMLWSESLFILILLILLLLMVGWVETRRSTFLIAGGIVAGLLLLTRYAGIGFVAGIILYMAFERGTGISSKLKSTVLFSIFTFLLPAGWLLYSSNYSTNPTNRTPVFHLISADHLQGLLTTIASWISPPTAIGALIFLLVLLYIFFRLWKQKIRLGDIYADKKLRLVKYMVIAYVVFLFISISFFDFSSPLDNRMLAPIFPFCLLLAVSFARQAQKTVRLPWLFIALAGGLLFLHGYGFWKYTGKFYNEGSGYTSQPWANSETIQAVETVQDLTIYTNGQEILQMFLPFQNLYLQLPMKQNPVTKLPNKNYLPEMEEMHQLIRSKKATLVFLAGVDYRLYYATKRELLDIFAGCNVLEYHDGFVIEAAK